MKSQKHLKAKKYRKEMVVLDFNNLGWYWILIIWVGIGF